MSTESAARIHRERAFHDTRFADDQRARIGRVYDVAARATDAYAERAARASGTGRVLEYGCGVDSLSCDLAAGGADVVSIDISPVAVGLSQSEAAERGVRVDYQVMDAERMTFADDSFDAVVGSGILHHLDLDVAVPEVARVLRVGGRAVFYEPLGHNPFINAFRRLTPALRTDDEHPLLMSDLAGLCRHFGSVTVSYHVLTALAAVPLTRFGRIGRVVAHALERVDRVLFRLVPPLRRYAWIVVIDLADPNSPAQEGSS